MNKFTKAFMPAVFAALAFTSPGFSQSADSSPESAQAHKKSGQTDATPAPSTQDIADAKSKHLVWVNTKTRVYHKDDSTMYGKTKHGKFMTVDDATKAGYRAADESGARKK